MKPSWQSKLLNLVLRLAFRKKFDPQKGPRELRESTLKLMDRLVGFRKTKKLDAQREDTQLGQIPASRFFCADDSSEKVILYLHGGGFYLPAVAAHGNFVSQLSACLKVNVYMPDYRLTPEYPFPAAPEDCLTSYEALLEAGYKAEDIGIAGDSAGGNLALVALISARDKGLPLPACAVLISPATDTQFAGSSIYLNAKKDPLFTVPALLWMRDHYLAGRSFDDPRASPVVADLSGLPPLMFHVGSTELLLDGSVRAHKKAQRCKVESTLRIWPQQPHVFPLLPFLPEARQATNEILQFMSTHLLDE